MGSLSDAEPPCVKTAGGGDSGATKTTLTLEDLATRPDLIAVDGSVVDVVALSKVHPGGEHICAWGGTDATGAFYSIHPHTAERNLRVMRERFVAKSSQGEPLTLVDGSKAAYPFVFDSPFAQDLKQAVKADLKARDVSSIYAGAVFWVRTALIMILTLASEVAFIFTGDFWAMLAAGTCHALIGLNIQHDASHGGMSKNPSVNAFFAYGADWVGSSRWIWFQQHIIGHHPHTNIEGKDEDAHSAEPILQFHWAPTTGVRRHCIRWQHLYMHIVLALYGPSVVYNLGMIATMQHGNEIPDGNPWMKAKRPFAWVMRLFFYVRIVALPMIIGGASWYTAMLGVPLVNGAILTFLFVVSHNFEGADREPLDCTQADGTVDWYKLQAETSCSYGGRWAGFFSGGLNMQIEHHLFPRMSSWQYPLIAPAVRKVCEKHNVKYNYYPSLLSNAASTVRFMAAVGRLSADDKHA